MLHTIALIAFALYFISIIGAHASLVIVFKLAALVGSVFLGLIALSGGDLSPWFLIISVLALACPVTKEGWSEEFNQPE